MKILIACEFSGTVRDAFIKAGHDAISCDLLPTESPGPHIQGDVLPLLSERWDMIIAHPPCTYLTAAGNRWFLPEYKEKYPNRLLQRQEAFEFFMQFVWNQCPKIAIENPIGVVSTMYRKPDQIIHPWWFGHDEKKATCLWLKGLPLLQPTDIRDKNSATNRLHALPPSPDRWKLRSKTYDGVAAAMATQWG